MKFRITLLSLSLLFIFACSNVQNKPENVEKKQVEKSQAQQIIDKARQAHGSDKVNNSNVTFVFRDRTYKGMREGGMFQYERIFEDSTKNAIRDVLSNDGFHRETNGKKIMLPEDRVKAFSNSVNSVLYFALLPYNLNDEAVKKSYLGETTIKGEPYHEVKITFGEENGGKDFEDEFVYFIHTEKNTIDYLAYNYLTDGGGARFREAYNRREIEGIIFSDYINYKPQDEARRDVENFDELFENEEMVELSRIDTENVQVSLNTPQSM